MNKYEFLAHIQHSDLRDGEFVIKLGDHWFVGNLSAANYDFRVGELTKVCFEGYLKEDLKK